MFDPPKTLGPASAMVELSTTDDPPAPSPGPSPGPDIPLPAKPTDSSEIHPYMSPGISGDPVIVPGARQSISPPQKTNGIGPAGSGNGADNSVTPNDVQQQQQPGLVQPQAQPHSVQPQGQPQQDPPQQDPTQQNQQEQPNNGGPQGQGQAAVEPDPPNAFNSISPTNIDLGPQPGPAPTTITLGKMPEPENEAVGLGNIINGALQNIFATMAINPNSNSPHEPDPPIPVITAAGQILTISNPSAIPIAGTTLTPGGAPITVVGTPISLAPGAYLVIGAGPPLPTPKTLTIAGQQIVANPTSFDIAGTPVVAGAPAVTIAGTPISLGASGNLIVGGNPNDPSSPDANVFTVGGQVFTANPAGFDIAGSTVAVGSPAILVHGTPISLGSSGVLVVGSSTMTLVAQEAQTQTFAVGNQIITADSDMIMYAGNTISAGNPGTTIDGTLVSLNSAGSLIVGTSAILLSPTTPAPSPPPTPKIFTADGQIFTAIDGSEIAADGATLTPGVPETTISGVPMKYDSDGLVVGGTTVSLPRDQGVDGTASESSPSTSLSTSISGSMAASSSLISAVPASPTDGSPAKHTSRKGAAASLSGWGLWGWWLMMVLVAVVFQMF